MDQVSAISTHLLSSNKLLYGPGKCYIYTSTIPSNKLVLGLL